MAAQLRLAITRTARRLRQEAGADLSPTLIAALATIERHGPLTPSELAELERVQRPTATRIVARLGAGGPGRARRRPRRRALLRSSARRPTAGRCCAACGRARTPTWRAGCASSTPDEVATLDRAAEILERLLEGERR